MATKLYFRNIASSNKGGTLPSAEQSTLTPDTNYFETDSSKNYVLSTVKGSAQASLTNTQTGDTAAHNYFCAKFVSNKLNQTSIAANTWTYNFAASQNNAAANFPRSGAGVLYVNCYVWKPSNGTKYGTILDGNTAASYTEPAGTTEVVFHGTFTGAAVASLTAGDAVIVFEVWFQVTQATATARTGTFYFDGTTENTTPAAAASNHASFLETPENLAFLPDLSLSRIYKYDVIQRVQAPSILLDGVDDRLNCGNHADLWSQGLTKFSMSFWIYPTLIDGTDRDIVRHGNAGSGGRFVCNYTSTSSVLPRFQVRKQDDTTAAFATASTLTANRWSNITCVYDSTLGSANVKIYVNKVIGAVTADLTDTINLSADLVLGNSTTDFQGNMKDFRFYDSIALSQTQINNIYDNDPTAPTPDYWLKMEEGTGNPVDSIGSKTTTLENGAAWASRSPFVLSGLTRIYKYHLLSRVSLSRTYLWNVLETALERVSLERIYKYNVLGRASLQRIYKYHVLGRISLNRIYKYHILSRLSLSRIYKYHVLGRTSLNRIYRFHVIGRVSLARIYKYNKFGRVSLSRIYKYNLFGRISLARIYKYHVATRVSLARIYKYHLLQRISLTRIYKYNILIRASLSRVYKHHVLGRVSLARVYKYNLIGRISLARVYLWNVAVLGLTRISKPQIYKYHVLQRLSLSRIYKHHIATRVSLQRVYKYNVIARVSLARFYKWNVLVIGLTRISLSRIYKYNVAQRLSLPNIYKYHIVNRISLARNYKYNIIGRITLQRIYRYTLFGRVSLPQVYKYNLIQRLSTSKVYKWILLQRVSLARVYKWNLISLFRISKEQILKYNLVGRVSKQSRLKWNLATLAVTQWGKVREWIYAKYSESNPSK